MRPFITDIVYIEKNKTIQNKWMITG
ncbi:uncharacterized protein METZ01_LOCUS317979 [marine metagenome]|uniref:Uncharacterized protein n=1 Tax=marine metagenome TaxID=408172 RepID=A0A382NXN3_9ZZZZ